MLKGLAHRACLQHHRLGHNRPKAIDRQKLRGRGQVRQTLHSGLCQGVNLVAQTVQDRETAGDGQPLVGLRQPPWECFLRSLVQPLGTETHTRMAHDDVVQPEHVGGLLAYQVRAFASRVPHGSLRLWVDVPLGQHAQS